MHCPNKNLKLWKDLVKIHGEELSYGIWDKYEGEVPDSYYQKAESIARPQLENPDKAPGRRNDPDIKQRLFNGKNEISINDILDNIEKGGVMSVLATNLRSKLNDRIRGIIVRLEDADTMLMVAGIDAAGYYLGDSIIINKDSVFRNGKADHTMLHELIHAIVNEDIAHNKEFNALFEHAKANISEYHYGLTDINEFIAEIHTNAYFIKRLQQIPALDGVKYDNLWTQIYDYILSLVGIGRDSNLYEQAFALSTHVIENAYTLEDARNAAFIKTQEKLNRSFVGISVKTNDITPKKGNKAYVKNKNVKLATDFVQNKFVDNNTKRYVLSKYFRMTDNKTYYPFSMGNIREDLLRVKMINAEFNGENVVFFNAKTETIEFGEAAIDETMTTNEIAEVYSMHDQEMSEFPNDPYQDMLDMDLPFTSERLSAPKRDLQGYEEVINRRENYIRLFKNKISQDSSRRSELQARIDILEDQIEMLKIAKTNKEVLNQASTDLVDITNRLNNIEANINKNLNEDQLLDFISQIMESISLIKGWMDLNQIVNIEGNSNTEFVDKSILIQGKFSALNDRAVSILKPTFINHANKASFKKNFGETLFAAIEDESAYRANILGAGMSNVELIGIIQDYLSHAAFSINDELVTKEHEMSGWLKKLQDHLQTRDFDKISEHFWQVDSSGNKTNRYVGKIKQDFFDERSKLWSEADSSGNWVKYYEFLAKNTFELEESEYKSYLREKAKGGTINIKNVSIKKLSNGEDAFTLEDLQHQEELIGKYEERKQTYIDSLVQSGRFNTQDGVTFEDEIGGEPVDIQERQFNSIIQLWDAKHNPWAKKHSKIKNAFKAYRVRDRIDSKWNDPKYDAIQKDPIMREFYEFMEKRIDENDEMVPDYGKTQSNELMGVAKTFTEDFSDSEGFSKVVGLLSDTALMTIAAKSQSEVDGRIIISGKVHRSVPLEGLTSNLPMEQRTSNIFKILNEHTRIAVSYKYKSQVAPVAEAAQELIDKMEEVSYVTNEDGRRVKVDKNDRVIKTKGELFQARTRLEYIVKAGLYNERKKAYEGNNTVKLSTGETVNISTAKIVDSLIKFTYLKALSFPNFISPLVNVGIGLSNNYSYAAGGIDFNTKSLNKAYYYMKAALSKTVGDKLHNESYETVMTWLVRLKVLEDLNSAAIEDSVKWDKWLTKLQSKGEYLNQGATTVAYLMHNTLKDKNGNDVPLIKAYKAINGQLIWDTELMGEPSSFENDEIISADGHGVNLYRLSRKVKRINDYLHGDYESALKIKETAMGRAAALFKTWIGASVEHRFGEEGFDQDLMRDVKGKYRSLVNAKTVDGMEIKFKKILPILLKGLVSKKSLNKLSEIDRVNLLRDLREFQIMGGFFAASMLLMLAAGEGDDDPIYKKSLILAMNLTSKMQADLSFYLNPTSLGQVVNNAIPIVKTMQDFVNIGTAFTSTVLGNGVYQNGPWKDQSKLMIASFRAFPVLGGGVKMWNYVSKKYEYR